MKKTRQQSLLNAVIAVVLSIVSIVAVLTFGIWIVAMNNAGVTFMGIPILYIVVIAIVVGSAIVDYLVRQSRISKIVLVFALFGFAAYLVFYHIFQLVVYWLIMIYNTVYFF